MRRFRPRCCLEESEDEERDIRSPSNAAVVAALSGKPARLGRLIRGDLARRAATVAQGELEEREEREVTLHVGIASYPLHVEHPALAVGTPAPLR